MIKKPYLHAKVMIQDQKNIYIGSHNFTTNALENNREIGLFLSENQKNSTKIYQDFISDGCK
jgi:phosphatidylserine/phosphatidylglycerophosphate/cardiolipin synthase-like enzyme